MFHRGKYVAAGVRVLPLVRLFHVVVGVFRVLRPGFVFFFLVFFVFFFHVFSVLSFLVLFAFFFLVLFVFFSYVLFVLFRESRKYFCFRRFPCDLVIATFSRRWWMHRFTIRLSRELALQQYHWLLQLYLQPWIHWQRQNLHRYVNLAELCPERKLRWVRSLRKLRR